MICSSFVAHPPAGLSSAPQQRMSRDALKRGARVKCEEHYEGSPFELWALTLQLDHEGMLANDVESPYSGGCSTCLKKIKTDAGTERERQSRPC